MELRTRWYDHSIKCAYETQPCADLDLLYLQVKAPNISIGFIWSLLQLHHWHHGVCVLQKNTNHRMELEGGKTLGNTWAMWRHSVITCKIDQLQPFFSGLIAYNMQYWTVGKLGSYFIYCLSPHIRGIRMPLLATHKIPSTYSFYQQCTLQWPFLPTHPPYCWAVLCSLARWDPCLQRRECSRSTLTPLRWRRWHGCHQWSPPACRLPSECLAGHLPLIAPPGW